MSPHLQIWKLCYHHCLGLLHEPDRNQFVYSICLRLWGIEWYFNLHINCIFNFEVLTWDEAFLRTESTWERIIPSARDCIQSHNIKNIKEDEGWTTNITKIWEKIQSTDIYMDMTKLFKYLKLFKFDNVNTGLCVLRIVFNIPKIR